MTETPLLVFCCCCSKSTIFASRRAVLCFCGDTWIPILPGSSRTGTPGPGLMSGGAPSSPPSLARQTWLCFSLPTLRLACELLRGTWVSANLQAEPYTGTGCRHAWSFPFCDGGKDLASCSVRFDGGSSAGAPRQMGRVKGTASLTPSCPQQSGY